MTDQTNEQPADSAANTTPTHPTQNPSSATAQSQAQPSVEALRAQIRAEVEREHNERLRKITGCEDFDSFEKKTAEDRGQHERLAALHKAEAEQWRQRYQTAQAETAITAAAIEAGAIDPTVVQGLLSHRAQVGDKGKVTIDGKDPLEAVQELLKAKPFLAKATSNQGSSAPGTSSSKDELRRTIERIANMHKPNQPHRVQ